MLTGVHILLTYKCTNECDHCFVQSGPQCEGTFTLRQIRELLREVVRISSVEIVYFEGGEPFLFYPVLLEALQLVRAAGLKSGIVTNGYWATSAEDAEPWLWPLLDMGIADFSVSVDDFHSDRGEESQGAIACHAAMKLGLPCKKICIEAPTVTISTDPSSKGKPVTAGGVRFRGRAAEKLAAGLPMRPWRELKSCPHEELVSPERVHVDAYGNVHICQGISIGNMWKTPLAELIDEYDASKHPIVGPIAKGGPAELVRHFGLDLAEAFVDECHLCYTARKHLLRACPHSLAPRNVYGIKPSPSEAERRVSPAAVPA